MSPPEFSASRNQVCPRGTKARIRRGCESSRQVGRRRWMTATAGEIACGFPRPDCRVTARRKRPAAARPARPYRSAAGHVVIAQCRSAGCIRLIGWKARSRTGRRTKPYGKKREHACQSGVFDLTSIPSSLFEALLRRTGEFPYRPGASFCQSCFVCPYFGDGTTCQGSGSLSPALSRTFVRRRLSSRLWLGLLQTMVRS